MARTLKQNRGYYFENDIVTKVNSQENWYARRLGGASTGLPDILMTNNPQNKLVIIEAKAGTQKSNNVPKEQLERCITIGKMFDKYEKKYVILAFKFSVKQSKQEKKQRKLQQYFVVSHYDIFCNLMNEMAPSRISCTYEGKVTVGKANTVIEPKTLVEFVEILNGI